MTNRQIDVPAERHVCRNITLKPGNVSKNRDATNCQDFAQWRETCMLGLCVVLCVVSIKDSATQRTVPLYALYHTAPKFRCHAASTYGLAANAEQYCLQNASGMLQAAASSCVTELQRSDHVSDALISLRWLRILQRIQFKVAILTYKVLHGCGPSYLPFVYVVDLPSRRALRSANTNRLIQPQVIGRWPLMGGLLHLVQ